MGSMRWKYWHFCTFGSVICFLYKGLDVVKLSCEQHKIQCTNDKNSTGNMLLYAYWRTLNGSFEFHFIPRSIPYMLDTGSLGYLMAFHAFSFTPVWQYKQNIRIACDFVLERSYIQHIEYNVATWKLSFEFAQFSAYKPFSRSLSCSSQ